MAALFLFTCCNSQTISDNVNTDPIVTETISQKPPSHSVWNDLLMKHVSPDGTVNYKGFKADYPKLLNYVGILGESSPNDSWSKQETLAYWINAYNALTIDLIIRYYPVNSIRDIDDPWKQRLWKKDGRWCTLDEIEHDILREMNEPRIHFAIVCASYSCPKLLNEAYIPSKLEEQLSQATRTFLEDPKRNSISENKLELSKIFKWFSKDFKQQGNLVEFLNSYVDVKISSDAKIDYKDYDWALNE